MECKCICGHWVMCVDVCVCACVGAFLCKRIHACITVVNHFQKEIWCNIIYYNTNMANYMTKCINDCAFLFLVTVFEHVVAD